MRVHRLVAHAFLGRPPSTQHYQVNHKDGNKQNNHISNPEYSTGSQNVVHSYRINPGQRIRVGPLAKPILGRSCGTVEWDLRYPSASQAARELELSTSSIYKCCNGVLKSTGGFEFKIADSILDEMLPGEIWKAALHPDTGVRLIPWEVSTLGRIRSSRSLNWGSITSDGYRRAKILVGNVYRNMYVQKLVARTFLSPPPSAERSSVAHKDGDPSNNDVHNLEYMSRSEINLHTYSRGRPRVQPSLRKPVLVSLPEAEEWDRFPSIVAVAKQLGLHAPSISSRLQGRGRRHGGYVFRWAHQDSADILPNEEWRQIVDCT